MEPRLGPDRCLRRWCRICALEMTLEYDSHSDDRVYDFSCTRCGTMVRIFEEIFQETRERLRSEGKLLEPLTREEEEEQILDKKATTVFLKEHSQLVQKLGKRKNKFYEFLHRSESTLQDALYCRHSTSRDYRISRNRYSKNQTGRYTNVPVLGPERCLKRRCRTCEIEMESRYGFNSRERRYRFHCTRCGTTVHLLEETFKDMRECYKNDGYILEPLTKSEQVLQTLGGQTVKCFFQKLSLSRKICSKKG